MRAENSCLWTQTSDDTLAHTAGARKYKGDAAKNHERLKGEAFEKRN